MLKLLSCCTLSPSTRQEREALSRERVNNMLENQVSLNIDRIRLGANIAIQINAQAEQGELHTEERKSRTWPKNN